MVAYLLMRGDPEGYKEEVEKEEVRDDRIWAGWMEQRGSQLISLWWPAFFAVPYRDQWGWGGLSPAGEGRREGRAGTIIMKGWPTTEHVALRDLQKGGGGEDFQ